MSDPSQHFYQAIAIIQGVLELDGSHPVITVEDAVFPAYASKVVRRKHQPGQVQNFRVYPCVRHKQPAFQLVNVVEEPATSITLMGCWELHKDVPYFAIYRNGVLNPGERFFRNLVPVIWDEAPQADGQFWQAIAQVRDGAFVITKAEGPFDPPPKARLSVSEPSDTEPRPALPKLKLVGTTAAVPAPTLPLTVEEIRARATPAKIQVVCKLNQVPELWELPDKRVVCYLKDGESDRIFTVQMKPKMFKKLTDHGFADWVAVITGEIGAATETGFELVNAAVQVFEKRAREGDAEVEDKAITQPEKGAGGAVARGNAVVEPKPAVTQTQKGGDGKKKGLLDGVRLK